MGIDYSGMMIVGKHYDDLPEEVLNEIEEIYDGDLYEWAEDNNLTIASEWYDCGTDGYIIGVYMEDVYEKDLDEWYKKLKASFITARNILKVEPKLFGTQDIY